MGIFSFCSELFESKLGTSCPIKCTWVVRFCKPSTKLVLCSFKVSCQDVRMFACYSVGNVNFDNLAKLLSSRFLYAEFTLFSFYEYLRRYFKAI